MRRIENWSSKVIVLVLVAGLLASCGFRRKKYENPIAKDTQQPDKVLFDKAINDIEKGRFEVARLTLQTLINTYDTSEFLAKAKLALADSYFREGGSHGLASAEAEYKDFILFYPTMEEAAEAQEKVCMIHYKQMEKPDRDSNQAMLADQECRQVLTQFPNSKFAPQVQQILRNIQEVLAESEFRVGNFYHHKGHWPASANRLQGLVDHYGLYSGADNSLWLLGDDYSRMGPRFKDKAADSYARIVKDYPLSALADNAREKLKEMERPIPEPDPVALNRMKYQQENQKNPGMLSHFWGVFKRGPDVALAARSGEPATDQLKPQIPASVPPAAPAAGGGSTEVTGSVVTGQSALDTQPDARQKQPSAQDGSAQPAPGGAAAAPAPGAAATQPAAGTAQPGQDGSTAQAAATQNSANDKNNKKNAKKAKPAKKSKNKSEDKTDSQTKQ